MNYREHEGQYSLLQATTAESFSRRALKISTFLGTKKSRFSWPTPFNCQRNVFARIKIITAFAT